MKKFPIKSCILVAISLIIICGITMCNYRKQIAFHQKINAIIRPNPSDNPRMDVILKKTTVEINAKIYRRLCDVKINGTYFSTELKGKIIIDNKEYTFSGTSPGESNRNWFMCYLDNNEEYTGFILYNLNVVEIFMQYSLDKGLLTSHWE